MIPDWLPLEPWQGFIEMRKKIRKPMTSYAEKLMVKRLAALMASGQDVEAVLEQSIRNSWQDVYPLRPEQAQQPAVSPAQLRVVPNVQWWLSDGGIITKGKSLGMDPRPGETFGTFKDRIFAKLNQVNSAQS